MNVCAVHLAVHFFLFFFIATRGITSCSEGYFGIKLPRSPFAMCPALSPPPPPGPLCGPDTEQ